MKKKKETMSKKKLLDCDINNLSETLTINDFIYWIYGEKLEDMFYPKEKDKGNNFDEVPMSILSNHFFNNGEDIAAYHNYQINKPDDPTDPLHRRHINFVLSVSSHVLIPDGEKRLNEKIAIEEVIRNAKAYQKITPEYLSLFMAYEKYSISDLQELFKRYLHVSSPYEEIRSTTDSPFDNPVIVELKESDFSISKKRIKRWISLIYRWIGWGLQFGSTIDKKLKTTEDAKIKLEVFQEYLKYINSICGINIPLPERLFEKETAKPTIKEPAEVEDKKEKKLSISAKPKEPPKQLSNKQVKELTEMYSGVKDDITILKNNGLFLYKLDVGSDQELNDEKLTSLVEEIRNNYHKINLYFDNKSIKRLINDLRHKELEPGELFDGMAATKYNVGLTKIRENKTIESV